MREFEGVLNLCRHLTTYAQYETLFVGAYGLLLKQLLLFTLRKAHEPGGSVMLIDFGAMSRDTRIKNLPRVSVPVSTFTQEGKTCLQRALLEAEFRFCGNQTPASQPPGWLTGRPVVDDDRELLATILDPRTKGCGQLSEQEANKAKNLLKEEYIEMALRMDERKQEKTVVIDVILLTMYCSFFFHSVCVSVAVVI